MAHTLKDIKKEFAKNGKFHTPKELAEYIKSFINNNPTNVYDPTCGAGGLLSVFGDDIAKYGQDIDQLALDDASTIPNINLQCGNVLTEPHFKSIKFDAIVGNPPFSVSWEPVLSSANFFDCPWLPTKSRADYSFILHILNQLADNGVASVLCMPGIAYRGNVEGKIRRWLIEENVIDTVVSIEGDTFVDTAIPTLLIVFKKNKTTTKIKFIDRKTGINRVVTQQEIKDKDYILSVNAYLDLNTKIKEIIDPIDLELKAQKGLQIHLKQSLGFTKWVCDKEGIDINNHLDILQNIINEYKIVNNE